MREKGKRMEMAEMRPIRPAGGVEGGPKTLEQTAARLAEAIDPSLAEVWLEVFSADEHEIADLLPWLLRMAYLCGHRDAQESPEGLTSTLGVRDLRRRA